MATVTGDFELSMDERREVARYVAERAQEVLPTFEAADPLDARPRAAIEAAWEFVNGARRSKLQHVASIDAHKAERDAPTEVSRLAAQAAGDAASAAYLHPIAKAHQVGHILRAAVNAARIAEIEREADEHAAVKSLRLARDRATPVLIDILRRYPVAPPSKSRPTQLMNDLDAALRTSH